jgi:hypothetical protein
MSSTILRNRITKVAVATAILGMAGAEGCSSCNSTASVGHDGGEDSATKDAGSKPDTGTKHDAGKKADAGKDSAAADTGSDASVCSKHLAAGFTQVVASQNVAATLTGAAGSRTQAMALDENDDPMIAYGSLDSGGQSIHFTRWDPCAGQFTTPITVDSLHTSGVSPDVSIAYDPTTKEVGIVYGKGATDNNWADDYGQIWLATMKSPATAFTIQQLSVGATDYFATAAPVIAMRDGNIAIAYEEGVYPCVGIEAMVVLLTSTAAPGQPIAAGNLCPPTLFDAGPAEPDAGVSYGDAGADAGAPPPHYFKYTPVPYSGAVGTPWANQGYLYPSTGSGTLSLAIDSNGVPAIAAYAVFGTDLSYPKKLVFWRSNTPSGVSVYSFGIDGPVDVSLAFDGTKPRIAGHMDSPPPPDGGAAADNLAFVASDDGITWSNVVHLPSNDGAQLTAFASALALEGNGHAAVAADINGGGGVAPPCGDNPYIATSPADDGGGAWTACGADTNDEHVYNSYSPTAIYGASRISGTLMVTFISNASHDAGADQAGIIYYQAP